MTPVETTTTAVVLYTSGTTGQPKGVELTHEGFNMSFLCTHLHPELTFESSNVFLCLCVLPNFHLAGCGMTIQAMYCGCSISIVPQFEPKAVLKAIETTQASLAYLVPSTIQMLVDDPELGATNLSSMRCIMYAGAPISVNLIKRATATINCAFLQIYGATETGGPVTVLRPSDHDIRNEKKLRSCGKPPICQKANIYPLATPLFEIMRDVLQWYPEGNLDEVIARTLRAHEGWPGHGEEPAYDGRNVCGYEIR